MSSHPFSNTASLIPLGLDLDDPALRPTPLRRGSVWLPYIDLSDLSIPGTRICFGLGSRHHQFADHYNAYTVADFHMIGMGDVGSIRRLLLDGAVLLFNLEGFSEANFRRDVAQNLPTANGEYRIIMEHCWNRTFFSLRGQPFPLIPGGLLPGPIQRVDALPPLPYYAYTGIKPRLKLLPTARFHDEKLFGQD